MIHSITLFVVVMLLTVLFLRQATADADGQRQDPDNTCYLTDTCKPAGSMDNPFNS